MQTKLSSWVTIGVFILVFLFLVKVLDLAYPLSIVTTTRSSEFSVVGEGKIEVRPDLALINVGITVNGATTVEDAQATINETNNKIVAAMKTLGIEAKDIKTSDYSIYPNYGSEGNQITGYNGNVSIEIKVRNTDTASAVVQAATKAGANQVNSTQFIVESPEKYRQMARDKAIANAKEQAQKLSNDLGIRLGKITNVIESNPYYPPQNYALDFAKAGYGGGGPAIETGSQTISSVVTLYFEKR